MSPGVQQGSRRSRPTHPSAKAFRPPVEKGRWAAKGTKPLPEQASVRHVLVIIVMHICRKVLFIQTEVKIMLYSIGLFFGSLICDFLPLPRFYLGQKDNIFNLYFVKLGWGWTFIVVGTFIYLTSATYSCGRSEIIKRHMSRLVVGTVLWFFWSQWFFTYVESRTGVCLGKAILKERSHCVRGGFQWHAFDISGHAFLLVYINLFLVEEAKAIVGWEGIKDLIRIEDHQRAEGVTDGSENDSPLKGLAEEELVVLKDRYENFTSSIRSIFFMMTIISILSDVMLTTTIMYFHTMPQKVAGGAIAIATWFLTYRYWYKSDVSPGLPGTGLFKYQNLKEKLREVPIRRRSSICKEHKEGIPMFMGMPLYGLKKDEKKKEESDKDSKEEDRSSLEDFGDIIENRSGRNGPFCEPRYRYKK